MRASTFLLSTLTAAQGVMGAFSSTHNTNNMRLQTSNTNKYTQ